MSVAVDCLHTLLQLFIASFSPELWLISLGIKKFTCWPISPQLRGRHRSIASQGQGLDLAGHGRKYFIHFCAADDAKLIMSLESVVNMHLNLIDPQRDFESGNGSSQICWWLITFFSYFGYKKLTSGQDIFGRAGFGQSLLQGTFVLTDVGLCSAQDPFSGSFVCSFLNVLVNIRGYFENE